MAGVHFSKKLTTTKRKKSQRIVFGRVTQGKKAFRRVALPSVPLAPPHTTTVEASRRCSLALMKKTSSPSNLNATKKFSPINLNSVYKPNGNARPGQNGRMLLGAVKKGGGVKKAPQPAAPKPLNLPSQKKENAGYDPKIALVPSGGSGWSGAEGPIANGQPNEYSDTPEPVQSNVPAAPAPADTAPQPSASPAKAVAWGGRGMTKPAATTPPAVPPQMMPIRPTEDLNRYSGGNLGGRWGGAMGMGAPPRSKPASGEQFPPLAPKEDENNVAEKPGFANGLLGEKINTVRDDSWADVDEEMSYDDADNLFDDTAVRNPGPKEVSPEEARARQIMRMEAAERKREEEEKIRRAEALLQEEAEKAALAKQQTEEKPPQDDDNAGPHEPELPAQDIAEQMRSQAESARERRQREEEQRQQEQKARADERLRELNEAAQRRKEEAAAQRREEEQRQRDARKAEEETRQQQLHEEEQKRWQTKSAWSSDRPGGADSANWRDNNEAECNTDISSSSMKRDTSRRKLWVPEFEREKPHDRSSAKSGVDRDRAIYEKKYNVNDSRPWRERALDSKEKELEEKKKREQRDKEQRKRSVTIVTKVEKKPDNKSGKEEQPGKSGRTEKKDSPQISLPAPLPKEGGDSPDKQVEAGNENEPSKTPNASWSFNKLRKFCEQNGIKKWCEQQSTTIKMNDKDDLLAKYKLWAFAKEKGEIANADKPKRTRAPRKGRDKKDDPTKKTEIKDDTLSGASAEDAEDDGKKRRTSRGGRKGRKEDLPKQTGKEDKTVTKPDAPVVKGEAKPEPSKPGLMLDEQMGLQDIACGLKVGPDGGYAVVEAHETVEDDSGFTTEVGKKEKKAQLREEAQQKEKVARKQRQKEAAKAKQQDKEAKAKADAAKVKSIANTKSEVPVEDGGVSSSGGSPPQGPLSSFPVSPANESGARSIQDRGAQPGSAQAKQVWGPKPAPNEKTDFTSIMLDQKFKQAFPEQLPFEVPTPKDPAPGGSALVGAERKLSGSEHDIWSSNSGAPESTTTPFSSIPFDTPVSSGFSGAKFTSSVPSGHQQYGGFNDGLCMTNLTPAIAQYTPLPSFASKYNNAFSAAPGTSDGWGSSGSAPSHFVAQQQLAPTDSSTVNPAGWSSQKPVGPSRNDTSNNNEQPGSGKGAAGEKQNRKSRGGKGRGKSGKDNTSKGKDGKAEQQGSGPKSSRSGRQSRRPGAGNQASGGKAGAAKTGNASAEKASVPVDAVIPAKSGSRRGGRNAKKGNQSSDKN